MNAIKTEKLTKKFGSFIAVDNLDLTVKKGELFGLLGVNGAGKTTTIKMLSCLSIPTSGNAWLNESTIVEEVQKVKEIISVSPQETSVAPNLTVRENLVFFGEIYNVNNPKERAEEIINEFSLRAVADKRAKILSGGWQRRVSIAISLMSNPKILFLDEPTLGLDVLARRELWEILNELKGKITIVLTTHYLEEAEALCDRIAIMVNGKIKAIGTADELKKLSGKDNFEDAFITIAKEEAK